MATPLSDLDELVLRCRDARARSLISEAVGSYRAGAFRSAIVATWVAVAYDLIEKLRELALAGDHGAEKQVERLERIRSSNDISAALAFERSILQLARDDFELISAIDYVDLERLQVDRNRCAHPSLADEMVPYIPSAELVRAHIYAAVEHVLRHPPAQGKFALERLRAQIDSEYFPTKEADAFAALSAGPLSRPRDSLVRNLVTVLIKRLLQEDGRGARLTAALAAIRKMHGSIYDETLTNKLSSLLRPVPDVSLHSALSVVSDIPAAWQSLDIDISQRFKSYVRALPSEKIEAIEWLVAYTPVAQEAKQRIRRATRKELKNSFFFGLSKDMGNRFIDLYLESKSYDEANEWAKELVGYKEDFDEDQICRLLSGAAENQEILGSFRFADLIKEFRDPKLMPLEKYDAALKTAGLDAYILETDTDSPF